MSVDGHFLPLAEILVGWARRQMADEKLPVVKFAERVCESYLRIVPDGFRTLSICEIPVDACANDYFRINGGNVRAVDRWLKGEVKFPLELLDAWVDSLDGEYRAGCLADLFSRHGVVPVTASAKADAATVCKTMHATADMLSSIVDIVSDGVIDERDAARIKDAKAQMKILSAQIAGWELMFSKVKPAA